MRRKVWVALCLVIVMLLGNVTGVSAEELPDGQGGTGTDWNAFEVAITTEGIVSAGADVTFNVSIKNITQEVLTTSNIACIYTAVENPHFGTLKAEDQVISDDTEEHRGDGIAFGAGETKSYTLSGTIPSDWKNGSSSIIVSVMASDSEGNLYAGQNSYSAEDTDPDDDVNSWEAYAISITPAGTVRAGAPASFNVSVTNRTKVQQKIKSINSLYDSDYTENSTSIREGFGVLKDAKGQEVTYENCSNITFAAGETKQFTLSGTIPAAWGEKSAIIVVVASDDENGKEYVVQGEYTGPVQQANVTEVKSGSASSMVAVSDDLRYKALTQEELESGNAIEVVFNSDKKEAAAIASEEKELIERTAGQSNVTPILDSTIDMTIQKIITAADGSETTKGVGELSAPINVTIQIPEAYRADGRVFSVIRLHGSEAAVLNDLDTDPATVTISTDKFSLYTLAYRDTSGSGAANANSGTTPTIVNRAAQTGDKASVVLLMIVCTAMAGIIAVVSVKRRKMR